MSTPQAYRELGPVEFPTPSGIDINMMPLILGDQTTWTDACHAYSALLECCEFPADEVCYLSIHEAELEVGESLRRPGVHTESTPYGPWVVATTRRATATRFGVASTKLAPMDVAGSGTSSRET